MLFCFKQFLCSSRILIKELDNQMLNVFDIYKYICSYIINTCNRQPCMHAYTFNISYIYIIQTYIVQFNRLNTLKILLIEFFGSVFSTCVRGQQR